MKLKICLIYDKLLKRVFSFSKELPKLKIYNTYKACIIELFGNLQGQKIYEEDLEEYKKKNQYIPSACFFYDFNLITFHLNELKRSIKDKTLKNDYGHPISGLLLHELGHYKWKEYKGKEKIDEESYAEAFAKRWCKRLNREGFFKNLGDK